VVTVSQVFRGKNYEDGKQVVKNSEDGCSMTAYIAGFRVKDTMKLTFSTHGSFPVYSGH